MTEISKTKMRGLEMAASFEAAVVEGQSPLEIREMARLCGGLRHAALIRLNAVKTHGQNGALLLERADKKLQTAVSRLRAALPGPDGPATHIPDDEDGECVICGACDRQTHAWSVRMNMLPTDGAGSLFVFPTDLQRKQVYAYTGRWIGREGTAYNAVKFEAGKPPDDMWLDPIAYVQPLFPLATPVIEGEVELLEQARREAEKYRDAYETYAPLGPRNVLPWEDEE